jgi:hypothetical protein
MDLKISLFLIKLKNLKSGYEFSILKTVFSRDAFEKN